MLLISSSLRKLVPAKLEFDLEVVRRCAITEGESVAEVVLLRAGECPRWPGLPALK
jgi:hypothetical protein